MDYQAMAEAHREDRQAWADAEAREETGMDREFEEWVERQITSLSKRVKELEAQQAEQRRQARAAALPVSLVERPGISVLRQLREED